MAQYRNIIISRTDKIGDFVVSIPSYATMKAMYPQARIIALVSKNNHIIARNVDCIDHCVNIDDFADKDQLLAAIRALEPDVFVALVSNNEISALAKKSGAPIRIGPYSKMMSFFHYNRGVRQRRSRSIKSEAEYNLDLVRSLDPARFDEVGIQASRIHYSEDDAALVDSWLKKQGAGSRPFILINPFTGGSGSNINDEHYAQVIATLLDPRTAQDAGINTADHAFDVIIMGMEQNAQSMEQMVAGLDEQARSRVHLFINSASLMVAAAMVDRCTFFIGPSTGITQIAGNYRKACICFYSTRISNSHTRWALYGDRDEHPVTLRLEDLHPETKKLITMTPEIKQQIVAPAMSALKSLLS